MRTRAFGEHREVALLQVLRGADEPAEELDALRRYEQRESREEGLPAGVGAKHNEAAEGVVGHCGCGCGAVAIMRRVGRRSRSRRRSVHELDCFRE